MKKSLHTIKSLIWVAAVFGGITFGTSQSKKIPQQTSNKGKNQNRGHQLYKLSKLHSNTSQIQKAGDNALERMKYEIERAKDPKTNTVPKGIKQAAIVFSNKIDIGNDAKQSMARGAKSAKSKDYSYWKNRGPYNVGGRTRALAIDITNENVIFAGGVSGGLWRSSDSGKTWRKVTNRRQNPSITTIAQDPRPGKHHIWYYGTGEGLGSASAGGAFFGGTGIFKSTNGGRNWRLLQSTNDGDITTSSPFDIINSLVINPTNGDIIVGTNDGVHRSQDGGNSFEEVLKGGPENTTEVTVTSTGQIYATISSNGIPNTGIFTSSTGDIGDWTKISPESYPNVYRTVIGIDPSNENIVYFFAADAIGNQGDFLFKYNANATTPEETWTDLTPNLPTGIGGRVGNLNLQGGYNMVVKVSPTDPNLVFIGGTNLYRSTTGFTTPTRKEGWIGGYSPKNDITVYPDQHPDQHALVFYPSNPNKVLSASDGGVAITEDITTNLSEDEPVDWVSLNNGYLTTQPYHVSFDPSAVSDNLLAGFQDNSTWFTSSDDPKAPWRDQFGGDGTYSAIADGGKVQYVSSQFGRIYRLNVNETGEDLSFTRVNPIASGFRFVTPFILDPNNDNIMYVPAGNSIWRNNDLDEIPLFSNSSTLVNWVRLENSETPVGSAITSLDVSTYPVANRLYYGTNTGGIYRMDNAIVDNQEVVDLSTGKGLPQGFVNDINVDPSNDNRVIVTFSNYNVISLFYTENAGETWTNISGNLEENADGTGNGPSVRSTAFFGGSQGFLGSLLQKVYAATSTGLYYTYGLRGENTRWYKENFRIGNAVADEVVTRKDGFIALAAHGNGLFSAKFPVFNEVPQPSLHVTYSIDDIRTVNRDTQKINIKDLFVHSEGDPIDIELTNTNPELVAATIKNDSLVLNLDATSSGVATVNLIATSGPEQVSEGLTITLAEPGIYDQIGSLAESTTSENITDFSILTQSADDFTVPEGNTWTVERILAYGSSGSSKLTNVTVIIYNDDQGKPGEEVYNSGVIAPISDSSDPTLNIQLPEAQVLNGGNYWVSVYTIMDFSPERNRWFWLTQRERVGAESHFKNEDDFFGTGATDWTPTSVAFQRNPSDQIFQIFGTVNENPEGEKELATLKTIEKSVTTSPNPSSDRFTFNFNNIASKEKVSIKIYNIVGNEVFSRSNIDTNSDLIWDASEMASGFYVVKILARTHKQAFKILKQ
ncbi:T9SS type A sorting domain-containing protein [Aquimarina sp. 2201CG1-2-11]|uniref:T9SS type A sorting domain-containing protein n=1 Tax=Aquimarina discodermiae TaxID=3231043 RepID=UPI003463701B